MKTNTQAWGWLAAGVMALGLNGIYHDGGAAWAHGVADQIAERTGPVLALASGRADLFLAKTSRVAARNENPSCRFATVVARVQSKVVRTPLEFAHFEAMSGREEAQMARMEARQARIGAEIARVRFTPVAWDDLKIPVICPRIRVDIPRVSIPKLPVVRVPAPPAVRVDVGSGGPV